MTEILGGFLILESFFPGAAALASLAVKTSAIVALSALIAWLLKSRSATARCWIWRSSIAGVFFVLLFSIGPSVVGQLRIYVPVAIDREANAAFARGGEGAGLLQTSQERWDMLQGRQNELRSMATPPWMVQERAALSLGSPLRSPWREISTWLPILVWGLAVILVAAGGLRAVIGTMWLHRRSRDAQGGLLAAAELARREAGLHLPPRIRLTEGIQTPLVLSWRGPVVYLPVDAADWQASRTRAVFLHEFAHWTRKDHIWLYIGRTASALFWWNPLVAFAAGRMSTEAEEAADDAVLLRDCSADDYARDLVDIASRAGTGFSLGVSMVGSHSLERRIKALLADNPWRGKIGRIGALTIAVTLAASVLGASVYVIRDSTTAARSERSALALSQEMLQVLQRAVESNKRRLEAQRFLHFQLETVTTETTGGIAKASPLPQKMDAWGDEWTGIHRADFRPRVSPWRNGAQPFWIANEAQINDGKNLYTCDAFDDITHPLRGKPSGLEFYLGMQETLAFLQMASNLLAFSDAGRGEFEYDMSMVDFDGARLPRLRERFSQGGRVTQERNFIFNPAKGDLLVLDESVHPGTDRRPTRYVVRKIGGNTPATFYPEIYEKESDIDGTYSVTRNTVSAFNVLKSLPEGVTDLKREPPSASMDNAGVSDEKTTTVRVVDRDRNPVADAWVKGYGMRTRVANGSSYSWSRDASSMMRTDQQGFAKISYPASIQGLAIGELTLAVDHPDFFARMAEIDPESEAPTIVVQHGAEVSIKVDLPQGSKPPVYADFQTKDFRDGVIQWRRSQDGSSLFAHVPEREFAVRAVAFGDGDEVYFSAPAVVNARAEKKINLTEELKPGATVSGRLGPTAHRPIRNGRVVAVVYTPVDDAPGLKCQWGTVAEVNSDGTFVLRGLPPGELEVVAICDGFVSQNPAQIRGTGRAPQRFQVGGGEISVPMEATGAARISVEDRKGRPVSDADVAFWPNQNFQSGSSVVGFRFQSAHVLRISQDSPVPFTFPDQSPVTEEFKKFSAKTNADGVAIVRNLPPGSQEFAVSAPGLEMPIRKHYQFPDRFDSVDVVSGGEATVTVIMDQEGRRSLEEELKKGQVK